MNCLDANSISTFGGSPITMAAGLANLTYLIEHDLQGNARRVGGLLIERLRAVAAGLPVVREVRGRGLMIGVELVDPDGSPSAHAATLALEHARERGLLIGKGGLEGNALRIAPPLSLSVAEAEEGAALLEDALRQVQAEIEESEIEGGQR
jgi:4-aminobutyrate aminotransferase